MKLIMNEFKSVPFTQGGMLICIQSIHSFSATPAFRLPSCTPRKAAVGEFFSSTRRAQPLAVREAGSEPIWTTLPLVSVADLLCKERWQFLRGSGFLRNNYWERSCVISIISPVREPSLLSHACPFFPWLCIWSLAEISFELYFLFFLRSGIRM